MRLATPCTLRWWALWLALALSACQNVAIETASNNPGLRFAFGGDLAGQNVCRDQARGFPIFEQILAHQPDFFVALGDMIYADDLCSAVGRYGNAQIPRTTGVANSGEDFLAHWDYVRNDPGFAKLLASTPYFAVWDDHEVRNDFSPANQGGHSEIDALIGRSRAVFSQLHEYDPESLYFQQRFGEHLELFFLDTRSYRQHKNQPDDQQAPKTMLGVRQREWLLDAVVDSNATWKIIVSSVPLSIPTGWPPDAGRDGWADGGGATGYERELGVILREFARREVRNLLVISADVHFASGFRYQPFDNYPDFVFYELVTGPLSAGLFPNRQLDPTLRPERLFFHGPASVDAVSDFETAVKWFNVGLIDIDGAGQLDFTLLDGNGDERAGLRLLPR